MKLNEKSTHRNLDDMFRLILLIYGRNLKKIMAKFMQDNLKNSMIVNLRKNRFLQQVQKIELIK